MSLASRMPRRQAAVTNGWGRFVITTRPGPARLVVYRQDGGWVAARVVQLPLGAAFIGLRLIGLR